MPKNITIYTTNTCSYCKMVKKYLGMKGLTYDEVNLDEQPDRFQEIIDLSGQRTVPVTVVTKSDDSRSVVVGYSLPQLAPALV